MSAIPSVDDAVGYTPSGVPWRALIAVTRPRVLALVTVTGLPVFGLHQHAVSLGAAAAILAGTLMVGGSCSALNAVLERDLDAKMTRTIDRPLPSGALSVEGAIAWGLLLGAAGCGLLVVAGTPLAGWVGFGTIAFYVGVYTGFLKRRTPQNIVIGGAAGATAPLIVDAAVDGRIGFAGLLLFLLIFLWTPAHFWAIALFRREEYAAASIPMMPNVIGDHPTRWRMLGYGALTVLASLHPYLVGELGPIYTVPAVGLGVYFLWKLVELLRVRTVTAARSAFMASNFYLLLLFVAMLTSVSIPG